MCFIVQCFALLSFPFPRPRFSILENAQGIFTVTTPPVAHKVHASFSPWQLNDMPDRKVAIQPRFQGFSLLRRTPPSSPRRRKARRTRLVAVASFNLRWKKLACPVESAS